MEDKIIEIISQVIEEINEDLEYDHLRSVNMDTPLFGGDESIDSISLAILITEVELLIEEKFNQKVILADEKAMSMKKSPYRNMENLVNFIKNKLEGAN